MFRYFLRCSVIPNIVQRCSEMFQRFFRDGPEIVQSSFPKFQRVPTTMFHRLFRDVSEMSIDFQRFVRGDVQ